MLQQKQVFMPCKHHTNENDRGDQHVKPKDDFKEEQCPRRLLIWSFSTLFLSIDTYSTHQQMRNDEPFPISRHVNEKIHQKFNFTPILLKKKSLHSRDYEE